MRLQPPGSDLCSPTSLHLEDFLFYSICCLCFSTTYYGLYLSSTWVTRTTSQLTLVCTDFLSKLHYSYCNLKRGEIQSRYFIYTGDTGSWTAQEDGVRCLPGSGIWSVQGSRRNCFLHTAAYIPFPFSWATCSLQSQIENTAILNYSTTETSALPGKFLVVMVSGKHDVSEDFEAQCLWEDLLGVRMATQSKQAG